ncbi:MAG: hypothetical protein FWB91_12940 [Defluviitaleaceae bacterium]|nr:hypothetical protein [Defluviitaleaceae bacterium]
MPELSRFEDIMIKMLFNDDVRHNKPLEGEKVFMAAKIEDGVVTWCDGEIDIAPEVMYKNSYAY